MTSIRHQWNLSVQGVHNRSRHATLFGMFFRSHHGYGEQFKWLTVISPKGHNDVELLFELMGFAPARTHQKALFDVKRSMQDWGKKPTNI